ncbi:MAG: NIPSNAP family protein [Gammaproteobacteria bacterium]|nr:NIPSNAP family protein [Gammaproteobacteria bacterium]
MFYELRQYDIEKGKMDEWIAFMEGEIIPFQVGKGMVIAGSFRGEEDDTVYVWIRRFASEADRARLYEAVYESDEWKNYYAPKCEGVITGVNVQRIVPGPRSVLQ